jgi:hypothetical protein
MVNSKETVRDAHKIAKTFVSQVQNRAYEMKYGDKFVIGYLESFLATSADKRLLDTMEWYIKIFSQI